MKFAKRLNLAAAFAAACCAATGIMAAEDFHGVTVNVMTFVGPQIAEPLQRRAPEFEKLTGAPVEFHCNMRATIEVGMDAALEANGKRGNAASLVADVEQRRPSAVFQLSRVANQPLARSQVASSQM